MYGSRTSNSMFFLFKGPLVVVSLRLTYLSEIIRFITCLSIHVYYFVILIIRLYILPSLQEHFLCFKRFARINLQCLCPQNHHYNVKILFLLFIAQTFTILLSHVLIFMTIPSTFVYNLIYNSMALIILITT